MDEKTKNFLNDLENIGIFLDEKQMRQFVAYYELLIEWNKVMNLTGITEFEEVLEKHFYDSLCIVRTISDLKNQRMIDIGTGAGFPGIPLKIVFPELKIVLLDSLNKRVKFLEKVIEVLELKDITAIHGRAEDLARKNEYRQQFDLSVSRAVANLSTLTEYSLPFLKMGGRFISYKSADVDEEVKSAANAVFLLGGKLEQTVKFQLPNSESGRSLICIKKVKNTPKLYPRKSGMPAKNPL